MSRAHISRAARLRSDRRMRLNESIGASKKRDLNLTARHHLLHLCLHLHNPSPPSAHQRVEMTLYFLIPSGRQRHDMMSSMPERSYILHSYCSADVKRAFFLLPMYYDNGSRDICTKWWLKLSESLLKPSFSTFKAQFKTFR